MITILAKIFLISCLNAFKHSYCDIHWCKMNHPCCYERCGYENFMNHWKSTNSHEKVHITFKHTAWDIPADAYGNKSLTIYWKDYHGVERKGGVLNYGQ